VRGEVMVVLCPAVLIGGLSSARQIFTVRYRASPLLVVDISTAALQAIAMSGLALAHAGVVAIAGALCVCTCLNTIVVVVLARRMLGSAETRHGDRLRILRMAIPLGIASLLASLYFTIDQVLLGWLISSRELGEYAAAVKLLSMVVTVPGFVMAAGIPGLARSADDRVMLSRFAGMLAHWLAVTALPLSIGLMVFARPAVELVFGPAYTQSIGLLRILMIAGVLTLVSNVLGIVLLSLNIIRAMLVFNVVSLAVNVAGNILLAPRYGVTASAWLTAACELIVISYGVAALRRRVSYRIVLAPVWRPMIATLLAAAVGLSLGANRLYAIALAIASFVFAVVALRAWPAELIPARVKRIAAPKRTR
jgi:O-antigen/teichoic acid export membrane protein